MPGAHSRLSPSSSHRWRRCPGAPGAEEDLEDCSGYEAAEGTVFHHYAALCLEFGFEPEGFMGMTQTMDYTETDEAGFRVDKEWLIEFDGEMADSMYNGLDFCRDRDVGNAVMMIEQKVDLSPWLGPNEFGTSDTAIIDVEHRRITVFDWKYGRGVPVTPEWNDQLILYGLGVWNTLAGEMFDWDYKDIEVEVVIDQERAVGGGGVWLTSMRRLLKEGKSIKMDAEDTREPNAARVAGNTQCKYCKAAKAGCYALDDYLVELLDLHLEKDDDEDLQPEPRTVGPEDRSKVLLNRKLIDKWMDRLHDDAIADAARGLPTPGQKVVDGRRPPRKFRPAQIVPVTNILEKTLGKKKAYVTKMLTPAAAEKILGKRVFEPLFSRFVDQGDSKPALVPLTDKRPALQDMMSKLDGLEDNKNENETCESLI